MIFAAFECVSFQNFEHEVHDSNSPYLINTSINKKDLSELTDKLEGALYMFFSEYHLPHLAAGTVFGYSDEQKGVLKRVLAIQVLFLVYLSKFLFNSRTSEGIYHPSSKWK